MATHFQTVYSGRLLNKLSATSDTHTSTDDTPFTQDKFPFDPEDRHNLIKQLPRKKSPGIDHITTEMLTSVFDIISLCLLLLFKPCWCWSYTPLSWRVVQANPIHKGRGSYLGNFSLISLKSGFRKLFQKSIYQALQASSHQLDIA